MGKVSRGYRWTLVIVVLALAAAALTGLIRSRAEERPSEVERPDILGAPASPRP